MGAEIDLVVRPDRGGPVAAVYAWQASGRSDLTWEETVRLPRRYGENWTLALDVRILPHTVRAVFNGGGAY